MLIPMPLTMLPALIWPHSQTPYNVAMVLFPGPQQCCQHTGMVSFPVPLQHKGRQEEHQKTVLKKNGTPSSPLEMKEGTVPSFPGGQGGGEEGLAARLSKSGLSVSAAPLPYALFLTACTTTAGWNNNGVRQSTVGGLYHTT